MTFAFFGSSSFSIFVLEELEKAGLIPSVVITTPDKPIGRKQIITPTAVNVWATARKIPVLAPHKLDQAFIVELKHYAPAVSVVASYGKIIPSAVLDIPRYKTLNVHPSLLPHYRGATPIQSAILDDAKNTGVSIIRLDELMDHGPLVASEEVMFEEWPEYEIVEETLGRAGGRLLAKILADWCGGNSEEKIKETEQDHDNATYTKKIVKEDGEIRLGEDGSKNDRKNFLKIQAYHHWPSAFFYKNGKRFKVTKASYIEGRLVIERVIEEGRPETQYQRS